MKVAKNREMVAAMQPGTKIRVEIKPGIYSPVNPGDDSLWPGVTHSKRKSQVVTVVLVDRRPGRVPGCPWRLLVRLADGRHAVGYFVGNQTHLLAEDE